MASMWRQAMLYLGLGPDKEYDELDELQQPGSSAQPSSPTGEPVTVPTGTQRGDLAELDWYFILGITATYNFLDNGLMGSRGRSRRKAGCRTGF